MTKTHPREFFYYGGSTRRKIGYGQTFSTDVGFVNTREDAQRTCYTTLTD
jgi:hypothetical protein